MPCCHGITSPVWKRMLCIDWFAERTRINLCTLHLDWFYTAANWNILCGMARESCSILRKLLKRLIYVYHYTKKTFLQWGAIISENRTNDCVYTHPWNCSCHENMPIRVVGMQRILSGYFVIQSMDVSYLQSSGFKNRNFAWGGWFLLGIPTFLVAVIGFLLHP